MQQDHVVPGSKSSKGVKGSRNESSREQKFLAAKVPGSEMVMVLFKLSPGNVKADLAERLPTWHGR